MEKRLTTKPTVLIVDDTPDNIALLSELLRDSYKVIAATTGGNAIKAAAGENQPDIILLDVMMPDMDGYEVCRFLKRNPRTADIPVIFLTAKSEIQDEEKGFELGAVDYITKPLSTPIVMARLKTHLNLKHVRDYLKDKSDYLEKEVARRTLEISTIQDVAMVAMGSLAETRDNETGNHIRRTQYYVGALAEKMKNRPRFKEVLTGEAITLLGKSAALHDIGKVGIPDCILLKPGKLTVEEFAIMQRHTVLGRDAIATAERSLDSPSSFLRFAREIAIAHHEKWDGSGYPHGLSGDGIPISGRLMAISDVYDALISKRVYKPAFPHQIAVSIIREGSGTHFDPEIVDAFLEISDSFDGIARAYGDHQEQGNERK